MNIQIVDKQVETITTKTYKLLIGDPKRGITYTWTDHVDENGFIFESTFRDENGNEITMLKSDLTNTVMEYIDSQKKKV